MSFWEDRFVNRPHSGALERDPYAGFTYAGSQGSAYQLPSPDEPTAWGSYGRADEIDPVEAFEDESLDVADEPSFTSADEDEPAYEHRRKGLFRRRQLVAAEAVEADDALEQVDVDEADEADASEPAEERAWSIVSEAEAVSDEDPVPSSDEPVAWGSYQRADETEPVEAFQVESLDVADEPSFTSADEDEPAHEYRRKGLFRRRQLVAVEAIEEDEAVEQVDLDEADEAKASEPAEDEAWSIVSEAEEVSDEDPLEVEDEEAQPAPSPADKKRGLFRRHKPVVADESVSEVDEASEPSTEPELELVASAEVDAEAGDSELELTEQPEEKSKRRGFFRRRKPAPSEESAQEPASVEDDAFGNISYWGVDGAHEAEESLEEPAIEPEQDEQEHEVVVYGQQEDAGAEDDAPVSDEEMETGPVPAPAHELVAESSEAPPQDDAFESESRPNESRPNESRPVEVYASDELEATEAEATDPEAVEPEPVPVPVPGPVFPEQEVYALDEPMSTGEPDTEPVSVPEPEPSFAEPEAFAFDDEPAGEESAEVEDWASHSEIEEEVAREDELTVEEPALVAELGLEHVAADNGSGVEELNGAGETELDETEHDEVQNESVDVVVAPVPLKKRNGAGGSRGKKVVGLKVGASQLAAAVVSGGGERPTLVDVARRPLEPGVVVGGEVRDSEALVHALRAFFKENNLPTKNVRIGLSSSRVGVRTFDIAGVEDELRFDNAVRFKAHEVLPVAAHESLLDYRVVEEKYTESGEVSRRVLLVVAPRDQVEPYVEACNQAGIRLAGVDLESFGLLRTFVPPFGSRSRTEDSATVVVAIGHEASTLLVAGGGICEFTRVFDWGGDALQNAIADELEVPHMEAATILSHLSLSGPGHHLDSLDAEKRGRALEAVRGRLTPFARELVSSLQFYQTQPESLGIRDILITGGTAQLEGLADALTQMIGVSVDVGDPLARVEVHTEIPAAIDATIGSLAVPIGLAIEDEPARSVNLLPKDARQTRKKPNALAIAVPLAAAIPVAALAFTFMQASGSAGDRQAQLEATRAEIDALPEPKKAIIDPALAGEQASRATSVAQILGGRLTWERVLGDVSRVLPAEVSLTELVATTPAPTAPVAATPPTTEETAATDGAAAPPPAPVAAPPAPSSVSVIGYALDYPTIARTLERLQAVPSLTNVELQSATPATRGAKRIISFTIVAVLATPGGIQ